MMQFSLTSLVRLVVFVGLALCAVAVGLGRLVPPPPRWRSLQPTRTFHLPSPVPGWVDDRPAFLDLETGRTRRLALPEGDWLDLARCAPWADERGESQVVGRWGSRSGSGTDRLSNGIGLGRFSCPEGRALDRVPVAAVPTGPPCWFPGTSARVLFAAGD